MVLVHFTFLHKGQPFPKVAQKGSSKDFLWSFAHFSLIFSPHTGCWCLIVENLVRNIKWTSGQWEMHLNKKPYRLWIVSENDFLNITYCAKFTFCKFLSFHLGLYFPKCLRNTQVNVLVSIKGTLSKTSRISRRCPSPSNQNKA